MKKTRTRYRRVHVTTLAGLRTAERLHANGWTIYHAGLFSIYFFKK